MIKTEKTLVEVLEVLRGRGYTEDFNLLKIKSKNHPNGNNELTTHDLRIDKIYRFSGQNDIDDEAILYAMHNHQDGSKGVFVNGYGPTADSDAHAIITEIDIKEDDDDDWTN